MKAVSTHVSLSDIYSLCGAGFEIRDAIALLRLDDLYIECFEIKDVKVSLLSTIGRYQQKKHKQMQYSEVC